MKIKYTFILPLLIPSVAFSQTPEQGKEHFYYQRYESAEKAFHQVLKADAANAEAWSLLVRTYIMEGREKKATDTLLQAPESIKQDPYYDIAIGTSMLSIGDTMGAKSRFMQALEKTKNRNADVMAAIAAANIESPVGDDPFAISLLDKAIKKDKKNAALYSLMGRAFRKQHKGGDAYQSFINAINKDDAFAEAYYELGRIFLSQKNAEMYLDYFQKAIRADQAYAPAYQALYDHYLYIEPEKAREYFQQYTANADRSVQQDYSYTDLLYLTRKYDSAIVYAQRLLKEQNDAPARLYKLIGYSYLEKADTGSALGYMQQYFGREADSNFVVKDFETMGMLYSNVAGREDSTMHYYKQAAALSTDPAIKNNYYRQLAKLAGKIKDHTAEAQWLGQVYATDPRATNVTLFNWGLAAYKAADYTQADSVFALYTEKYQDQGYGYYWRARANAAIDTAMEQGLAIPHYQKLIEVIDKDTLTDSDKKWMKEAYGYLASYEANTEKDYPEAISYFEKLLEIDPENEQVQRNIDILEKNLAIREKSETGSK